MKTYIALLRGINVSGHKKIKMADLKAMFISIGFEDVATYIQSGNIVFKSDDKNIQSIEVKIKKEIAKTFDFDVAVLVKTKTEIKEILKESPYTQTEDLEANKIYYVLLKEKIESGASSAFVQEDYPNELFSIGEKCVYLNCLNGAGKAKLTNNVIERKLKVTATTRNHRTMLKLLDLSVD